MSNGILIHDGIIVPLDGSRRIIDRGFIVIEDNRIASIGKMNDLDKWDYEIRIDAKGKAVLPGFVNSHTHLATECFRGVVDLFPEIHFTFVVKDFLTERHIYDLSLLGCLELIRFGVTCAGDNYQCSKSVAQAMADIGIRGVVSEQISQADLFKGIYPAIYRYLPQDAERQIRENEELIRRWHNVENGKIRCSFGPHAPDTLTLDVLREISSKAKEFGVGIMIHLAQSIRELQIMLSRHHMTSVEYLEKAGVLGPKTVAAHCIHLNEKDIKILKESGTHVAHCPNNFIRRGQITPIIKWIKGGLTNISLASDNILHDPFELMRFSNYLAVQYVEQRDPSSANLIPSPFETLEMATKRSAEALGLGDEVGSLEIGKKADVIIVDIRKPHLTPNLDLVTNLVHYANGNDIETVIIDGKIVMENRKIKTLDEERVLISGQKASEEVWRQFSYKYPQFPEIRNKFIYFF
ncbi:MAG: amidohydrolase [Candidatus Bathyarchaeia archaeon]